MGKMEDTFGEFGRVQDRWIYGGFLSYVLSSRCYHLHFKKKKKIQKKSGKQIPRKEPQRIAQCLEFPISRCCGELFCYFDQYNMVPLFCSCLLFLGFFWVMLVARSFAKRRTVLI